MNNDTVNNEKSQQEKLSSGGSNMSHLQTPYKRGEAKTFPQKGDEDIKIVYAGDYDYSPNGEYLATCIGWEKAEFYRQEKLYIWFEITEGAYSGKQVFMPFNIYQKKLTPGSKYYLSWCKVTGTRPKKNDRMSPRHFLNKIFKIKVRQVTLSRKRQKLEQPYSVVDEILQVLTGGIS